jgi:hypothetical protein
MELAEAYASLANQLAKLLKGLSPAQAEALATGQDRLVILTAGSRIIDTSPAIEMAVKAAQRLTAEQEEKLRQPGSSFKPVFKGGRVVYPVSIPDLVADVSKLRTEDEIIRYLDSDDRLKPSDLKKVAKELGVEVPPSAKDVSIIGAHIARSLASYRMS